MTVNPKPTRWLAKALLAIILGLLVGCFGVSHNRNSFPYWGPTGDIIPTHAKPPGFGYFRNFDRHAQRLEVKPFEATNPVQTQHVLIATVSDEKGNTRRNRRVEWILEGVGNIVEVDESGFFPGRGYKVDNKYAVSYTEHLEHTITRGNDDPADDFVIRPGQTWCVITAAVEGDTHVTAFAPEIYNWDHHRATVSIHWVDALWRLPPAGSGPSGTEQVLVTQVFRPSDRRPLADYQVRYRIIDGPAAFFLPNRSRETVVSSDFNGNAVAALVQESPASGSNRIGIEIIRPRDPTTPSGTGIVIGTGETRVDWLAPQMILDLTITPTAAPGQDIPVLLTVRNPGAVATQEITVRQGVPGGLQFVRSEPSAVLDGDQLIWTLTGLAPGEAHTLQPIFRSTQSGSIVMGAEATSRDGLRDQKQTTLLIAVPQLAVQITAPTTAAVGSALNYQIDVRNTGSSPATNVMLLAEFDVGLDFDGRSRQLRLPIGTLGPGQNRTETLKLTARQPGQLVNRVTATADGNLTVRDEHTLQVQQAALSINLTGPTKRFVNRNAQWDLRVSNTGELPLTNVHIQYQMPQELTFVSAGEGGTTGNGGVSWMVALLQPGEQKQFGVTTRPVALAREAMSVAVATAESGVQAEAKAVLEINGLPAFRLEVKDLADPVEVGRSTRYQIDVRNQGTLPANQVEIIADVPPEMKIEKATGPAPARYEGQRVLFPPVDSLQPGQRLRFTVDVQAIRVADARVRVELRSSTLRDPPIVAEESTTILSIQDSNAPMTSEPPQLIN